MQSAEKLDPMWTTVVAMEYSTDDVSVRWDVPGKIVRE
jgi:hypothetical protein